MKLLKILNLNKNSKKVLEILIPFLIAVEGGINIEEIWDAK